MYHGSSFLSWSFELVEFDTIHKPWSYAVKFLCTVSLCCCKTDVTTPCCEAKKFEGWGVQLCLCIPKASFCGLLQTSSILSIEQPHLLPIQGFPATACSSVPCAPPPRHRYHGTAPPVAQPWEMDSGGWQLALWTSELLPVRYGFTPSPGCSLGHQEWTFSPAKRRKTMKIMNFWVTAGLATLQKRQLTGDSLPCVSSRKHVATACKILELPS